MYYLCRFLALTTGPLWLILALALTGCGNQAPLAPPGIGSTVAVHIWNPGAQEPTVLVADRIHQVGQHLDRIILENFRARVLWPNLDCAVTSPSGEWTTATGLLTLAAPVHIAGAWQTQPMLGVASAASLSRDGGSFIFKDLELWRRGDVLTAPIAEIRRNQEFFTPRGSRQDQLPVALATWFATLPDPMVLPR